MIKNSNSNCWCLGTIDFDFHILISYPDILLYSLSSQDVGGYCFGNVLRFARKTVVSSVQKVVLFLSFQSVGLVFALLVLSN
jgi:hypothetical protein